jgi:hypothetical protein
LSFLGNHIFTYFSCWAFKYFPSPSLALVLSGHSIFRASINLIYNFTRATLLSSLVAREERKRYISIKIKMMKSCCKTQMEISRRSGKIVSAFKRKNCYVACCKSFFRPLSPSKTIIYRYTTFQLLGPCRKFNKLLFVDRLCC